MTLSRHPYHSQPIPMTGCEMGLDQRAVDLGRIIKSKRLDLGLNRPAFVREMARHGEEITPDYLNKLESGVNSLTRASLKVREGIRIVLGYTTEEWQKATGLYASVDASKPDAVSKDRPLTLQEMINNFSTQALINVPLPEGLVKAIDEYGGNPKYVGLTRENVQRQLSLARFYDGRGPQTAVEWLTYYLSVKDWIEE
jgi:hypothetical protein